MRISDWSSDVCSSALGVTGHDDARRIDAVVGGTGVEVRVCGAVLPDDLGDGHLRAEGVVLHGDHEPASGQAPRDIAPDLAGRRLPVAAVDEEQRRPPRRVIGAIGKRSEEHTSELQSLMRISYAVFCLKKKKITLRQRIK